MKRIAVHVATTGGPVLIQRITPEYAPQSMMCLGRSSDVLPISGDYDDFVKPGSGVIVREFGPFEEDAFRLDVSGPIGAGRSWQLGVFTAHAIEHTDGFSLCDPEDADIVLWMTGMVDYDLHVRAVDHIAEKVQASRKDFARWQGAGRKVFAVASKGNNHNELLGAGLPEGVRILAVGAIEDALAALNLTYAPTKTADNGETPWHRQAGLGLFALVAAAFAVIVFNLLRTAPDAPNPATPVVEAPGTLTTGMPLPPPNIAEEDMFAEEDGGLSLILSAGDDEEPVFGFGDHLEFTIELSRDAWLNCFYYQADGKVVQLYPNPFVEEIFRFEADTVYEMPSEEFFPFRLRFAPPAGEEAVVCFASEDDLTEDLPEVMRGNSTEPLPPIYAVDIARIFHAVGGEELAVDELVFRVEP